MSSQNWKNIEFKNLWPWAPAEKLLSTFEDVKQQHHENGIQVAPKLRVLDFGFLGYNVLDNNLHGFLETGVFHHIEMIKWDTRMSIFDYDHQLCFINDFENFSNVYWDGCNLREYFEKNKVELVSKQREMLQHVKNDSYRS